MLLDLKGKGYYQCGFTAEDHVRLRDALAGIKGRFILSYDDHPEIRELYKGFEIIETAPVAYSMNNRPGSTGRKMTELIVRNF